jgi:hypothetical protein
MSSANPYAAPQSDINAERPMGATGSLEDALAGRYDFTIEEVMREAWGLTNGFKLTYWLATLLVGIGSAIVTGVLGFILGMLKLGTAGAVLVQVVSIAIALVMTVGTMMLSVRRAAGLPVSVGTVFGYLDMWLTALVSGILLLVIVGLGFVLLIIPGIYLSVAYYMTFALLGDRKMGAWQAMETSRKAVSHKWFKVFGTFLVTGLLTALSALLIIPLIWTLPWMGMVMGVVYRRIYGVASTA